MARLRADLKVILAQIGHGPFLLLEKCTRQSAPNAGMIVKCHLSQLKANQFIAGNAIESANRDGKRCIFAKNVKAIRSKQELINLLASHIPLQQAAKTVVQKILRILTLKTRDLIEEENEVL